MPSVLTTQPGDPHVEISGLPTLPADGKGGVTLERAAEVLTQLQTDDGEPLTGAALKSAAKRLAEQVGVRITRISDAKVDKLAQLADAAPDRPAAAEVAEANYDALYGPLEAGAPGTPTDPEPSPPAGDGPQEG